MSTPTSLGDGAERSGFKWPALRDDARGRGGAFSIALAVTAFGLVVMSSALVGLYVASHVPLVGTRPPEEVVTFVATPPPLAPPRELSATLPIVPATSRRGAATAPTDPSASSARATDAIAAAAPVPDTLEAKGARSSATATATIPTAERPASLVFLRPSAFARSSALQSAQRDSVLQRVSSAVPALARTRRPTQVEIDSFYREDALRQKLLREHGRPVPIAVGAVSISFPLFSRGPSRARRMRDSLIHHDNLLRLERITGRAGANRDSSRTDSLTTKTDTLRP